MRIRGRLRKALITVHVLAVVAAQAAIPDARWGAASTVFGSRVMLHGGKTDPTNAYSYTSAPSTNDLLSLDLSTSFDLGSPPWAALAPSTSNTSSSAPSLAFHTITAFSSNELLYFGGDAGWEVALSTRNDSAGTLWLNGNQPTWTVRPEGWGGEPMRRVGHSAASWDGKVVITGGEKDDGSHLSAGDPYVYDSPSKLFSPTIAPGGPPDLVGHASLALANGTLLVFGGYSNSLQALQPLNTIYTYTISGNGWSSVTTSGDTVPDGRRNFVAVAISNDDFLIHGGADAALQNGHADAFVLNVNTLQWTAVPALSDGVGARWDHTAFAIGPQVFFGYGYTATGPASNQLLLFDTSTSQFLSSFTPPSNPSANTNSPIIYPPTDNGNDGGWNPPSSGGNNDGNPNPNPVSSDPTPTQGSNTPPPPGKKSSTGAILGGVFGTIAAAAVVIVIILVYRKKKRDHRRGWSGDSEKAQMVSGFAPVPQSGPYALVARVLHIPTQTHYAPAPRRDRFDMLADEDNTEYDYGVMGGNSSRARMARKGTSGSGETFGAGRWSLTGGGSLGGLVNASVSSFRSALGFGTMNNMAPTPSRDSTGHLKGDYFGAAVAGSSSRTLPAPPTAWRRGSSYQSKYGDDYSMHNATPSGDPFGDEHGVEEEYQRAMGMQHEMLRRASSSGADEYSALVLGRKPELNRKPSEGSGAPHGEPISYAGGTIIPLEPVPSLSEPSTSHAHDPLDEPSVTTHNTSLRTPADDGRYIPRISSPASIYGQANLQRATSSGSRIGASLSRTMSAISSLFGGGNNEYVTGTGAMMKGRNVSRNYGKNAAGGYGVYGGTGYEYLDLRDPNPPPPALGAGLIPIEEGGTEDGSRNASKIISSSEGALSAHSKRGSGELNGGIQALVLRPLHEKSLSSLKTANSEALERLATGDWNVVQRIGTASSRHTGGTTGSEFTDLGADEEDHRWADFTGHRRPTVGGYVDSPADLKDSSRETFWEAQGPAKAVTQPLVMTENSLRPSNPPLPSSSAPNPSSPVGPRPIPPPKRVGTGLAARMEALGIAGEALPITESPTSARPMSPPERAPTNARYGFAPKPTLFIANPGRDTSGSST